MRSVRIPLTCIISEIARWYDGNFCPMPEGAARSELPDDKPFVFN